MVLTTFNGLNIKKFVLIYIPKFTTIISKTSKVYNFLP